MKVVFSKLFWPLCALGLLLIYNLFASPSFFALEIKNGQLYGSLIDIALRASPLILTSLGMTLVIATGGVDLSVGTVAALAGAAAAWSFAQGAPWQLAVAAVIASGFLVGAINALLITKLGLQPIIATLIAMVTGRGVAQLLINGQIAPLTDQSYVWIGTGALLGLPVSIWLFLFSTLALLAVLRKTSAGLFIEAIGSNPLASRYIGLSSTKVKFGVYLCAGLMAALAGMIMSANIKAVDGNNLGTYLELDAILAVVIGGTRLTGGRFTLIGSVLGAVIIQTVTTTINTQGVPVQLMLMVKAAVVIAICLVQSDRLKFTFKVGTA